jgi:lysophospholipase L1-like esterase
MRRSLPQRIGRTAGIILAVLVLGEIVGQVAGRPSLPPDPDFVVARELCYPDDVLWDTELFWRYRPNRTILGRFLPAGTYTINSRGFRTPEFDDTKSEGTMRVVCLGGSTTFGWGVNDGVEYPRQLETQLNILDPEDRRWEVINLGGTNYSSYQGRRVARAMLPLLKPDVVLLNFSWGDHQRAAYNIPDSELGPLEGWRVRLVNATHSSALARWSWYWWRSTLTAPATTKTGAKSWRVAAASFSTNLEAACAAVRTVGARGVVVTSPISMPPPGFSDFEGIFNYHHRYRRMARYAGTLSKQEFVELANAFDEHPEFFNPLVGDFQHFSAAGHAFAGEFLARYLLGLAGDSTNTEN